MLHVANRVTDRQSRYRVETYNLGTDEYVEVNDSVKYICNALGLKPKLEYSGGNKGWIGDNPFIFLDTKKNPRDRLENNAYHRAIHHPHAPMAPKNQWVLQRR